ncbi:MAG: hypothetical protein WKF30_05580, partial [Pyrinomonadaceae bacterium]
LFSYKFLQSEQLRCRRPRPQLKHLTKRQLRAAKSNNQAATAEGSPLDFIEPVAVVAPLLVVTIYFLHA